MPTDDSTQADRFASGGRRFSTPNRAAASGSERRPSATSRASRFFTRARKTTASGSGAAKAAGGAGALGREEQTRVRAASPTAGRTTSLAREDFMTDTPENGSEKARPRLPRRAEPRGDSRGDVQPRFPAPLPG